MKLHGQRCGLSERAGSKIMEYGSKIDMKILNGGVCLERILAVGFLSLLSFAFVLSEYFKAWKRMPGVRVCRFVSPSKVHVYVCVCPCTRMVITYNHPKCLYCTNSITMLTEWLCGMGIAGPAAP